MPHNKKFMFGLVLLISNFIVGKIAIPFFAINIWYGLSIYLFSWLMLFAGIYLCGREGLDYAQSYYHVFKQNFRKNTLKSFRAVKSIHISRNHSNKKNLND